MVLNMSDLSVFNRWRDVSDKTKLFLPVKDTKTFISIENIKWCEKKIVTDPYKRVAKWT